MVLSVLGGAAGVGGIPGAEVGRRRIILDYNSCVGNSRPEAKQQKTLEHGSSVGVGWRFEVG